LCVDEIACQTTPFTPERLYNNGVLALCYNGAWREREKKNILGVHGFMFACALCAIGGVVSPRAPSAERRPTTAFASNPQSHSQVTQHNISPRSIRISHAARRTRSTSSSEHPFHNCVPSSAHRRHRAPVHQTRCSLFFIYIFYLRVPRLGLFFSLLHLFVLGDGLVFLIASCRDKNTHGDARSIIVIAHFSRGIW